MHEQPMNHPKRLTLRLAWQRGDLAGKLMACELLPSGHLVIPAVREKGDAKLLLVSARDGAGDHTLQTVGEDDILQLVGSPDSKSVALLTAPRGSEECAVSVVPLQTTGGAYPWKRHDLGPVSRIQFSDDGQLLAVCTLNGQIHLVSAVAGQEVARLGRMGVGKVRSLAFSPTRKGDLAAAYDTLHLLDVFRGGLELEARGSKLRKEMIQEELTIAEEPWFVSLLDDRSLACATRPGRLYLLGVADRSQIADPLDIAHAPTAFVRSPRSDYIACGTSTGDVYVVSREHWGVHLPKKCGARITDLTFSPDPESRLIAAAAASGVVHVWDYISGLSVPLNRGAVAGETFLRFSSDGTRLLVSHADGVIIEMWELIWGGLSGAA